MRHVDLKNRRLAPDCGERTARQVRHLAARLADFAPGGPEVLAARQEGGVVSARFPGRDTGAVLAELERRGILAGRDGEAAVFTLSPDIPFEDLDYLWGCLNDILF